MSSSQDSRYQNRSTEMALGRGIQVQVQEQEQQEEDGEEEESCIGQERVTHIIYM
ncbi:hypothetical protein D9758_009868 [Tetrapyrgos nigripes]|uniref:Uncharacterized protein n=1 Tax=Tetrapyrgos nigripes TaxID=182062 RepID=A0A8H5GMI2_9AGAR|nr:hypothetical protein D9758_009868 [Tetrapyrgos nigripes]